MMKFNINFRLFVWTYGVVILSSIINVILWNIYLFLYTKYFIFDIALYYKNICNYFSWFPGKLICYINFFSISIMLIEFLLLFLNSNKENFSLCTSGTRKKTINFIKIIKNHKIKTTILYVLWCAISICLCLAFPDREQRAAQLQKKMEEKQNQEVMHKVKNSAQEENIEKVPPKQ